MTRLKDSIYQLKSLNKRYCLKGQTIVALDDVSLDIPQASIVGIIGRSGAGKSTLLRMLNLLEQPNSGEIIYNQQNLLKLSNEALRSVRHEIGMIFQHFNLLSRRTALENVMLPLEILGMKQSKALKRAQECLEMVNLQSRQQAYPAQLSGGQKQRVAIARALATHAKVLLCDEATSALDPETTHDILQLLKNLNRTLGLTVALITHEISVIRDICHHVFVMEQGQLIESGPVEQIFSSPSHAITQSFIESLVHSRVPEVISQNLLQDPGELSCDVAYHLLFTGETAQKPIVAELIHQYGTQVNIISGYIDHIGNTNFGTLIITLPNNPEILENANQFLNKQKVIIKKMGYLANKL